MVLFYSQRGIYYFMTNSQSPYSQGVGSYEKQLTRNTLEKQDATQIDHNDISTA